MTANVRLYDVVALIADLPERGLVRGQVGTAVEELAPSVYMVEFSDNEGRTYALAPVPDDQLMVLHFRPVPTEKAPPSGATAG
jgi:hypothetical protein